MRILVSRFAAEIGGAEKSFFAHLKAYRELGHEVVAFTNLSVPEAINVPRKNALWFRGSSVLFKLFITLPQLFQCWWLIITNRIDVINAHSRFDQIAFTLLKPLHRRPVVWKDPLEMGQHLSKPRSLARWLYVSALRQADAVYVLSNSQKNDLLPHLPESVDSSKIVVIPSGIDFSRYHLEAEPAYKRKGINVGYAARLHPAKGVDTLLRAFAQARKSLPELSLLIMGEGEHLEKLRELSDELGLGESVEFLPYSEDISPFLRSLDIYVCPSLGETWGLGVHEARLFGLPIIASRVGGLAEQITDGDNGLLVEPEDAEAFASAIVTLAQNKELAESLGVAARKSALELGDFSETVRSELIPLLEKVSVGSH